MSWPWSYGVVDPLVTAARYTDVATVKSRIGIPAADTTKDAAITAAIVAAEYALDAHLGRSFPDPGSQSFEGPYLFTTTEAVPASGEITFAPGKAKTSIEVHKTDAGGTDHSGATLPTGEAVAIFERNGQPIAWLDIASIDDQASSWIMPFTLEAGELPAAALTIRFELLSNDGALGIGPVLGIPGAVTQAALSIAIAVYKSPDAPVGAAGSEDFFGVIDVADIARRVIQRDPTLQGFKVSSGFGVA
jgi:hypothetical protein